jgi:hypothetical protein
MHREPVRTTQYAAALVVAAATFFTTIGQGLSWQIALGTALGQVAVVAFSAELARSHAYSPASAEQLMDADVIIRQAEQR